MQKNPSTCLCLYLATGVVGLPFQWLADDLLRLRV